MSRVSSRASRLLRYLLYTLATLIVVFAIALNLARIFLPRMQQSRQYLEGWASAALSRPVSFESLTARWRGMEPVFQFDGVIIHSPNKHSSQLAIHQLDISISWWQSLLNMRLVPGHVEVIGTKFHIQQLSLNKYLVNNVPVDLSVGDAKTNASDFSWLFHTGFYLSDSNVYLQDMHGNHLHLSPVELAVKSDGDVDQIAGLITFKQTIASTVRFSLHIDTNELKQNKLRMRAYAAGEEVSLLQWQNFLQKWIPLHEKVRGGKADVQLWLDVDDNKVKSVASEISLHYFGLQGWHLRQRVFFPNVRVNCSWSALSNGWIFNVSKLHAHLPGLDWPDNTFSWQQQNSSTGHSTSTINIGFLRLQDLPLIERQLDGIPLKLRTWYNRFSPYGDVHDLRLSWNAAGLIALQAQVSDAAWQAWQQIPAMNHVNLRLKLNKKFASVLLQSSGGDFRLPTVFTTALHYNYLNIPLKLNFKKSAWHVATHYNVQLPGVNMHGGLSILAAQDKSPRVDFLAGYSVTDLSKIKPLFPQKKMGKVLYSWLTHAFVSGRVASGTMLWRGPLSGFPYLDHSGHFEVLGAVRNLDFHYLDRWPDMLHTDAKLLFDNRSMYADLLAGSLNGMQVKTGKAVIKNMQYAHLYIDSKLAGDLNAATGYMRNTPLSVAKTFKAMDLSGPATLSLHLDLPLKKQAPPHSSGVVTTAKANLFLKKWKLNIKNLAGVVKFHDDFLDADKLSGIIFAKPAIVDMHTKEVKSKKSIRVKIKGSYSGEALRHYLHIRTAKYWSGDADYNANLDIPAVSIRPTSLNIKFAGEGNKFNLPGYFYKPANAATAIDLNLLIFNDNKLQLRLAYGRRWNAAANILLSPKATALDGLNLQIGAKLAAIPTSSGVSLFGYLPTFDYAVWHGWLKKHALLGDDKVSKNKHSNFFIKKIDLSVGAIKYNKHIFNQVALVVTPDKNSWRVALNAPVASGIVYVPDNFRTGILRGTLNHLNLNTYSSSTENYSLGDLPNLSISINSLAWAGTQYGAVAIESRSRPNHFDLLRLVAKTQYLSFAGSGSWDKKGASQVSNIQGRVKSNNFGSLLDKYKLSDLLAEGQGFIDFDLNWRGSFRNVLHSDLSGTVKVNVAGGRITKISKSSESEMGIGRVLSLLSLQTLPRRLSLNFDDLFKSGYSFDSLTGSWFLQKGVAKSNDSIVEGPVAKVLMQGELDFPRKRYDLFLRVQPHLTGSLPVIATVIGTPIAGAITWAFNKILINPLVGRVLQSSFKIDGTWDKPKIKQLPNPKSHKQKSTDIPHPRSSK